VGQERRRHIRLNAERGLIQYHSRDGKMSGAGQLMDVSEGGARFRAGPDARGLAAGQRIDLLITLGTAQAPLRASAEIRTVKKAPRIAGVDVAVMFADMDESHSKAIKDAVMQLAILKIRGDHYDRTTKPEEEGAAPRPKKLGEILVQQGHVTPDNLRKFMVEEFRSDARLGEQLVSKGMVTTLQVMEALGSQVGLPVADLSKCRPRTPVARRFRKDELLEMAAVPFFDDEKVEQIKVALAGPPAPEVSRRLRQQIKGRVQFYLADRALIYELINASFVEEGEMRMAPVTPGALSVQFKFYNAQWEQIVPGIFTGTVHHINTSGSHFVGPKPANLSTGQILNGSTRIGISLTPAQGGDPLHLPSKPIRASVLPNQPNFCLYAVSFMEIPKEDRDQLHLLSTPFKLPKLTKRTEEFKNYLDY
jgi:hypothetical protein